MRHNRNASRKKLRPCGRNSKVPSTFDLESNAMKGALPLAVLHFRLGDRRAEVHIPHSRCFPQLGLALVNEIQERSLADAPAAFVDGRITLVPVDRQREQLEGGLELLLVLLHDLIAHLDE